MKLKFFATGLVGTLLILLGGLTLYDRYFGNPLSDSLAYIDPQFERVGANRFYASDTVELSLTETGTL